MTEDLSDYCDAPINEQGLCTFCFEEAYSCCGDLIQDDGLCKTCKEHCK